LPKGFIFSPEFKISHTYILRQNFCKACDKIPLTKKGDFKMQDIVKMNYSLGTLTCTPIGDIDHHAEGKMRVKIDKAIYEYRPESLVIDFSSVGFTDSSCLGLIMGRKRLCEELSVKMSLSGISGELLSMLRLTGLISRFEILQKS
jgi:stage II sporulation protein AA (anti-sigma F factor antagonist)